MFVIRNSQKEAFASDIDRQFCERLSIDVRRLYYSTVCYSEENLLALIVDGIRRARSYGLTWESSIADFVGLMFDVGLKFDKHPKINKILKDGESEPNLKTKRLINEISESEWRKIRQKAQF